MAHSTFAHLTMPVPHPFSAETSAAYGHAGKRIASMTSVSLTLPPLDTDSTAQQAAPRRRHHMDTLATSSSSSSSSPDPPPTAALDLMMSGILSDGFSLSHLQSLHLLQHDRNDLTSCQVSRKERPTTLNLLISSLHTLQLLNRRLAMSP